MSRIRKAYVARFRRALEKIGARQVEQGIERLLAQASQRSAAEPTSLNDALTQLDGRLQRQVESFCAHRHGQVSGAPTNTPLLFWCDAGLGGLARWLRAAGYEALWSPGIDDSTLVRKAAASRATLLTTDSLLLERRVIRDGTIPTVWLPPTLRVEDGLALVFRELHLSLRAPRCMSCGGELRVVDKATVAGRIPPRTALWLDEYFLCARCGRLFWRGTHWQRISASLASLAARPDP